MAKWQRREKKEESFHVQHFPAFLRKSGIIFIIIFRYARLKVSRKEEGEEKGRIPCPPFPSSKLLSEQLSSM